jgi:hypothetical protein
MKTESPWLVGRQQIADYANCSPWTVTMMLKAGLRCYGGGRNGAEARTKREWVDDFFENNPDFVASRHRVRVRFL